jgi:sec-independent protein translocase protein TatA
MKFGSLGIWEILIILVVILLIFGPRRLPEMAKGIGQSVREFRKGIRDMKDDIASDDAPKKATVVESTAAPTSTPPTSTPMVVTAPAPEATPEKAVTVPEKKEEAKPA